MLRLIYRLLVLPFVVESTARAQARTQARRGHGACAGVPAWLTATPTALAAPSPAALERVA